MPMQLNDIRSRVLDRHYVHSVDDLGSSDLEADPNIALYQAKSQHRTVLSHSNDVATYSPPIWLQTRGVPCLSCSISRWHSTSLMLSCSSDADVDTTT